jgi:hypothetical protein
MSIFIISKERREMELNALEDENRALGTCGFPTGYRRYPASFTKPILVGYGELHHTFLIDGPLTTKLSCLPH